GRYRTQEQVFDEESGELLGELALEPQAEVSVGGVQRTVGSPAELNQLMLEEGDVEGCLAQQYFKFVNRRNADPKSADACVTEDLAASAAEIGLQSAFRKIAEYQSFYHRKVGPQ